MDTPGLIEHQTITTIVENVTQARADVAKAFTLLQSAKARLNVVLGDGQAGYCGHIWPRDISDYNLDRTAQETDIFLERNAWHYVLDHAGLRSYMTHAREKELQEQLEQGKFPPLTTENVLSTLQGLTGQLGTLVEENAKEVFDWLRPRSPYGVGALKTNKRWHIGIKVIVGYAVAKDYYGGYRLQSYVAINLRALGNIMSLLDGHGIQQYPDDLCTQLTTALAKVRTGDTVSTPYLLAKPYKNGNMHITFLRPDLVDRLNHLGGNGALPGVKG